MNDKSVKYPYGVIMGVLLVTANTSIEAFEDITENNIRITIFLSCISVELIWMYGNSFTK